MDLTPFTRLFLGRRVKAIDKYATSTELIQRNVLKKLVSASQSTEWGIKHGYAGLAEPGMLDRPFGL